LVRYFTIHITYIYYIIHYNNSYCYNYTELLLLLIPLLLLYRPVVDSGAGSHPIACRQLDFMSGPNIVSRLPYCVVANGCQDSARGGQISKDSNDDHPSYPTTTATVRGKTCTNKAMKVIRLIRRLGGF